MSNNYVNRWHELLGEELCMQLIEQVHEEIAAGKQVPVIRYHDWVDVRGKWLRTRAQRTARARGNGYGPGTRKIPLDNSPYQSVG
jgi:hypothetical protein